MDAQLTELLTNYGPIGGIWFDGWWDKPQAPTGAWRQTYALIHRLQPTALIGSNHHQKPFPGEDFQMFEKDLPGHSTQEFNKESEIGALPLETCDTINNSWGYNKNDKNFKSTTQLDPLPGARRRHTIRTSCSTSAPCPTARFSRNLSSA